MKRLEQGPATAGTARGVTDCEGVDMPKRTCSIEGCGTLHHSRGWCRLHYNRWKKHGDPMMTLTPGLVVGTVEERFWAKVAPADENGCLRWIGSRDNHGYGNFKRHGEIVKAHRIAYVLNGGEIPDGMVLDHTCHNRDITCHGGRACPHRLCVNAAHLEPVTNQVNCVRGRSGAKTHCKHGHEFTSENTRTNRRGCRECRTCIRQRTARKSNEVSPDMGETSLLWVEMLCR